MGMWLAVGGALHGKDYEPLYLNGDCSEGVSLFYNTSTGDPTNATDAFIFNVTCEPSQTDTWVFTLLRTRLQLPMLLHSNYAYRVSMDKTTHFIYSLLYGRQRATTSGFLRHILFLVWNVQYCSWSSGRNNCIIRSTRSALINHYHDIVGVCMFVVHLAM